MKFCNSFFSLLIPVFTVSEGESFTFSHSWLLHN